MLSPIVQFFNNFSQWLSSPAGQHTMRHLSRSAHHRMMMNHFKRNLRERRRARAQERR
jgi:hypothetical protein